VEQREQVGQPLVRVSALAGRPSFRRPVLSPRLDSGGNLAQRQPRFPLVRAGHAVKLTQQVSRGPSQEALALRAELVSHWPAHVLLYGLPGAPGHGTWRTAKRRPGDLDDRELL
jgi:hypothetical protein